MSYFELPERPTISDVQKLYREGDRTVVEVVEYFYDKIDSYDNLIQSLLRTTRDLAFTRAKQLDEVLDKAKKDKTKLENSLEDNYYATKAETWVDWFWFDDILVDYPLFGVPFVLKDNILVEGELATSASNILADFRAPFSSEVYKRMFQAGAVLLGQSNMDEFAFGSSTEKSAFHLTRNPHDPERVPGGTSGGSAAAVAQGLVPVALGSDTGGSIRQPSSFCGTVGIRPTYGLVPRTGVMASTSSFDQVGPLTNSVLDNALVLSILQGKSKSDQTSLNGTQSKLAEFLDSPDFKDKFNRFKLVQLLLEFVEAFGNVHGVDSGDEHLATAQSYLADTYSKKPVIGIPKEYFGEGLSLETRQVLDDLITKLKHEFEIVEVELSLTKYALSVYYILQFVESTANLERYDGIRYGKQFPSREDLFFHERDAYFGPEVKRRIMLGTYASSAGYYDAYYNKACQARELMRQEFLNIFEKVDLLLMPTSPTPAFKIGSMDGDPMAMYLADIMTVTQPPSRLPALVVPISTVDYDGARLPVGAQLVGPELSEDVLYRVAYQIEKKFQKI